MTSIAKTTGAFLLMTLFSSSCMTMLHRLAAASKEDDPLAANIIRNNFSDCKNLPVETFHGNGDTVMLAMEKDNFNATVILVDADRDSVFRGSEVIFTLVKNNSRDVNISKTPEGFDVMVANGAHDPFVATMPDFEKAVKTAASAPLQPCN